MYRTIALLCAAGLLAGCGLTGDLYLPEDADADSVEDTRTTPADNDDGETEVDEE